MIDYNYGITMREWQEGYDITDDESNELFDVYIPSRIADAALVKLKNGIAPFVLIIDWPDGDKRNLLPFSSITYGTTGYKITFGEDSIAKSSDYVE